jgi:hypothetical protein
MVGEHQHYKTYLFLKDTYARSKFEKIFEENAFLSYMENGNSAVSSILDISDNIGYASFGRYSPIPFCAS